MIARAYLDWNATAPLRAEARTAMHDAMDVVGNPSSVHTEGRAAKALVERSRERIAAALGAEGADIIFTSGATEAAALAMAGRDLECSELEHEAVLAWAKPVLAVNREGLVTIAEPSGAALQAANSETGILQDMAEGVAVCDAVQAWGKVPLAFNWLGCNAAMVSAHKFGGPKGVGALIVRRGTEIAARIRGGGQEMGRRAGTENVIGIAGFAAAAEAAVRELDAGIWNEVAQRRDQMEAVIAQEAPDTIFVGKAGRRLANTSCMIATGWKGETQVMQMDLAGFAVSAGSACSSGKVRASRALKSMGYDDVQAASAVRVSIGPTTTEDEILRFAQAWTSARAKHAARAA